MIGVGIRRVVGGVPGRELALVQAFGVAETRGRGVVGGLTVQGRAIPDQVAGRPDHPG